MPTFKTIEPVLLDGKHYPPESEIELSAQEAKPLLELGAIADSTELKAKVPEGEEKLAIIKAAIAGLNPEDKELFTNAGVAKTTAIEAITGWAVSAAERDAAIAAQ